MTCIKYKFHIDIMFILYNDKKLYTLFCAGYLNMICCLIWLCCVVWCGVVVLDFLSERVNVCGFELSTIGLWLFWSSTLISQLNQSSDDYIYIRIINFCAFVRACVNHLVVVIHTTIVFYCFLFYLLWTFHCAYLACVQILSSLSIFHFLLHQLVCL